MLFLLKRFQSTHLHESPRIVKILLLQQFFEGFVPIMALYAIMFERVGGLSFDQIGLLFAIWSLAYLVTELPSGVLADYWSRRNVIIIGGVLRAIGFAIWLIWPSFSGYAIGFALWGSMIACTSGAVAAYLHNELKADGHNTRYAKYFGWITSVYFLGSLIGYLVASVLTLDNTNLLIGLSIASSLLFAVVLAIAPESPYQKQSTYLKTLAAGSKEILQSKKLRYMCYGLFSVYMIIGVLEELLPRTYANFGLSDTMIALTLAAALVLTVTVLARLETFVRFSLTKQVLFMALGVVFLLLGLWLGGVGGSVLVLLFSLVFQLFRPLFQHHIQETATGDERATIGSIPGLAAGLFGAAAYVVIGKIAGLISELSSIAFYGAFWLCLLLVLAYTGRKYRVPTASNRTLIEPIGIQPP